MSWIKKELNQQNQQINDEQMLDALSRELWQAVIRTINADVETINTKHLSSVGGSALELESHHGGNLHISKIVFPAYYIDVDFDLRQKTIKVKHNRAEDFERRPKTSSQQFTITLDESKAVVLSGKDKSITLEELSQFVLAPVLRR